MELEDKIGYHFNDTSLLETALTHSSYANERKAQHIPYNERLEFLGDAVLSVVVSDYIFKHCPELPEGELRESTSHDAAYRLASRAATAAAMVAFGSSGVPPWFASSPVVAT